MYNYHKKILRAVSPHLTRHHDIKANADKIFSANILLCSFIRYSSPLIFRFIVKRGRLLYEFSYLTKIRAHLPDYPDPTILPFSLFVCNATSSSRLRSELSIRHN